MVIFNRTSCQPLSNGNLPPLFISFELLGHASLDYRWQRIKARMNELNPQGWKFAVSRSTTVLLRQADTFIGRGDDEADRNRPIVRGWTVGDRPDQSEPRTRWPVSLRLFSSQLWSYCSGPAKR